MNSRILILNRILIKALANPQGAGGTLIFSYIRRLGHFSFFGSNFLISIFLFGFSEKNNIF